MSHPENRQHITYLTVFACQVNSYMYMRLPCSTAPAEDISECKIHEIFKEIPNAFCNMGNIRLYVIMLMVKPMIVCSHVVEKP